MKIQKKLFLHLICWLCLTIPIVVYSGSYENLSSELNSCLEQDSDSKRLACYDKISNELNSQYPTPSDHKEVSETASRAPIHSPDLTVSEFGRAKIEKTPDGTSELFDRVVEIVEIQPNRKLFKLSSGQVWRQMSSKKFYIRENDEIRIYRKDGRNSYILTVKGRNSSIQVERAL